MAHRKKKDDEATLSYKFKVKVIEGDLTADDITKCIAENAEQGNHFSEFIHKNLTSKTIGEFASQLPAEKRQFGYYQYAIGGTMPAKKNASDEDKPKGELIDWSKKPFYVLFSKGYSATHAVNLIFNVYLNSEEGKAFSAKNSMNLSKSQFAYSGFVQIVCANYASMLANARPDKIKFEEITEATDDGTKKMQVVREMAERYLMKPKNFASRIEYLEANNTKGKFDKTIQRLRLLQPFFEKNEESITELYYDLSVKALEHSGQCTYKGGRTISILEIGDIRISRKENAKGYLLTIPINRKSVVFDLYGRKDTIGGDGRDLIDIMNTHGSSLQFTADENDIYLTITATKNFIKEKPTFNEDTVLGGDVNIKHSYTVFSASPKDIPDFVNFYEYFAKDGEIMKLAPKPMWDYIVAAATKFLTILPIETPAISATVYGKRTEEGISRATFRETQKLIALEKAIERVMKQVFDKYNDGKHPLEAIYIGNAIKYRRLIKGYLAQKKKYYSAHSEYDKAMGYTDDDTDRKENMDERRFDDSKKFRYTPEAQALLDTMHTIEKKIVGCVSNAISYAYHKFDENGFNVIALENLTSATFAKKYKSDKPESIKKLLNFDKLLGKTLDEAKASKSISKHPNWYELVADENGCVSDIRITDEGQSATYRSLVTETIMKVSHFAETKDRFIGLANSGRLQVGLVPSQYTSYIDSTTHTLYAVIEDGKTVLAPKEVVRASQERHINGLNADYNSALNLKYMITDENFRKTFTSETSADKFGWGKPMFSPTTRSQDEVFSAIKKIGAITVLED